MSPNSLKNLKNGKATQFKPGKSGNPSGKPGTDLAALAARRFFEAHPEIGAAMKRELRGFNAHAFQVLADRGYGKVKESAEVNGNGGFEITVRHIGLRDNRD